MVTNNGAVQENIVALTNAIRPSIYLKTTIKIESGNGTVDSPYILST